MTGYDTATMAGDVAELATHLGFEEFRVAGEDWGAAIAYAVAAFHRPRVRQLVFQETLLPGLPVGPGLPGGEPDPSLAADADQDRPHYADPISCPVLAIGAQAYLGDQVAKQLEQVARDVRGVVIPASGHNIALENPAAWPRPTSTSSQGPQRPDRPATRDRTCSRRGLDRSEISLASYPNRSRRRVRPAISAVLPASSMAWSYAARDCRLRPSLRSRSARVA